MFRDQMSPRQLVAQNLLDTVIFGELDSSRYARLTKEGDGTLKSAWVIPFTQHLKTDGIIRVITERSITIEWHTNLPHLEQRGLKKFRNEWDAKDFLISSFIDR